MGFGARLRDARDAKGLSQSKLGEGLGTKGKHVTKAVVSGWEREAHYPKVDQLILMCDKLGASAEYLVQGRVVASFSPEVAAIARRMDALPLAKRERVLQLSEELLRLAAHPAVSPAPAPDESLQVAQKNRVG